MAGMQSGQGDSGTSSRLLGTVLVYLAEKKTDVFVVFAANSILGLPPELLRRGRADDVFYVSLPNATERRAIWEIHLNLVNQLQNVGDISELVRETEGYSGAEIESIVQDALYRGFDVSTAVVLTSDKLMAAVKETVPLSKARADDLRALKNWAATNARAASEPDPGQDLPGDNKMGFGQA